MIIPKHYKDKHVFIFGLGIDGIASTKSLLAAGANLYIWDDNEKARAKLDILDLPNKDNINIISPNDVDWSKIEDLILSPGVPFTHPEPADIVKIAKRNNVRIICSLELLYESVNNAVFIGITGTNGKSTTTALINHILNKCRFDAQIGGNFGVPVMDLDYVEDGGVYVIEMSSYQLDLIDKFKCDISVLLNITPDHLDRHGGMKGYIKAKKNIFRNMDEESSAIISLDNEYTAEIYEELITKSNICNIIPISTEQIVMNGVTVMNDICL